MRRNFPVGIDTVHKFTLKRDHLVLAVGFAGSFRFPHDGAVGRYNTGQTSREPVGSKNVLFGNPLLLHCYLW